jgi:hypothetical protein
MVQKQKAEHTFMVNLSRLAIGMDPLPKHIDESDALFKRFWRISIPPHELSCERYDRCEPRKSSKVFSAPVRSKAMTGFRAGSSGTPDNKGFDTGLTFF